MLRYTDFTMARDGFAGHMAEPPGAQTACAVLVMMGGEKSILPGIKIAERLTDFGMTGLAVSLFGAPGLPTGADRIPLEMAVCAVRYLRETRGFQSVSVYGMSMGAIFAALTARYAGGVDALVLCSPAHAAFEGTADKKRMSGHSVVTWQGRELPFVRPDFSAGGMMRYHSDPAAGRPVTRMWTAYHEAYRDKAAEQKAALHLEKSNARILLAAAETDEVWPSAYSAMYLRDGLRACGCQTPYKLLLYPGASHLLGIMPSREKNKALYRALPMIGLLYRSFAVNRQACLQALEQSEGEIVRWLRGEGGRQCHEHKEPPPAGSVRHGARRRGQSRCPA